MLIGRTTYIHYFKQYIEVSMDHIRPIIQVTVYDTAVKINWFSVLKEQNCIILKS